MQHDITAPFVSSTKKTSPAFNTLVSPSDTVICTSADRLTINCRHGAVCHE